MSWGFVAGTVATIGGSFIAGKSAEKAARTQAEAAGQSSEAQLQLMREQLEATQPLRDLALQQGQFQFGQQKELLPLLSQEFKSGAGLAPFFQQQLQRGTEGTISALAPFGLGESGVAGKAIGELGAGLGTQELLARRNLGLSLAGSTPSFFGGGTAGLGTAAQLGQGAAQSQFLGGQSTAAGQLGAGQAFTNPLLQLGGFGLQGGFNNLFSGTGQNINTPNAQLTAPSASGFVAPPQGQRNLTNFDFSRLLQ